MRPVTILDDPRISEALEVAAQEIAAIVEPASDEALATAYSELAVVGLEKRRGPIPTLDEELLTAIQAERRRRALEKALSILQCSAACEEGGP